MSERKPVMSEARRKVLNLLEYCLECKPDTFSVYDLLVEAHPSGSSAYGIQAGITTDDQWMLLLERYADTLSRAAREANRVDST